MSSIKETLNNANVLVTTQNVSKNTVLKLEQECNKHLSNVNNKLQMCINMFNTVINDICKSVLKINE